MHLQRRKFGFSNPAWHVPFGVLVLIFFICLACASGPAAAEEPDADGFLDVAKRLPTAACPAMTLESIANVLFTAPKWEVTTHQDGSRIVHVYGFLARTNNKLVVARVQHVLNSEQDQLLFYTMDITGLPQPKQTYTVLMGRECEREPTSTMENS